MEQRVPMRAAPSLPMSRELARSILAGLGIGLAVLLAIYLGLGAVLLRALPLPGLQLQVAVEPEGVVLDAPLVVETAGWNTTITGAQLIQTRLDPEGRSTGHQEIPVRFQAEGAGGFLGSSGGRVVAAEAGPLLEYDSRYTLRVHGEGNTASFRGLRTEPLTAERVFETPRRPVATLPAEAPLGLGETLTFRWNVPVATFDYALFPDVPSRGWLSDDGLSAFIALDEYQQGTRFGVEIFDAETPAGAPLRERARGGFVTPEALRVVGMTPESGATNVGRGVDPIITFNAQVVNPLLAKDSIVVEPATPGQFKWLSSQRVQFVTDEGFPGSANVKLTVLSGPDYLRAASGAYVEDDVLLAYRTMPAKRIEVSLARQTVTLFEDDRVVYSTAASTGVRGAETPKGNYRIQYKMDKTRMRGTYPDGKPYDVPDVPWVMALFGDYALHGAPWRTGWGVPLSNGCVSMPNAAAKHVYDWTPVGTPVHIY